MNTTETSSPALGVTGVTKGHANRAIKWLRNRSLLAWYGQGELRAFEFKQGRDWTYKALTDALEATR